MDIELFSFFYIFAATGISICIVNICNDFYIVVNLIHDVHVSIMWIPVFEIQYDEALN